MQINSAYPELLVYQFIYYIKSHLNEVPNVAKKPLQNRDEFLAQRSLNFNNLQNFAKFYLKMHYGKDK